MKNIRDKDPRGLSKDEIRTAETILDEVTNDATKIYFSGKIHGVSIALDGDGLVAAYLLSALTKATVEYVYGGCQEKENKT